MKRVYLYGLLICTLTIILNGCSNNSERINSEKIVEDVINIK